MLRLRHCIAGLQDEVLELSSSRAKLATHSRVRRRRIAVSLLLVQVDLKEIDCLTDCAFSYLTAQPRRPVPSATTTAAGATARTIVGGTSTA